MNIQTAFSCGDKGWVYRDGVVQQYTVGQVQVTVTDSKGCDSMFDNYKAQKKYEERYMCEETGIGSGNCYNLNEQIFLTEEECREAYAIRIKEQAEEKERQRLRTIEEAQCQLRLAQLRLEQLGISEST